MARTVTLRRQGGVRSRAGQNGIVLFEQDETYLVKVDSATENRLDILCNTPGLPIQGSISLTTGMTCKNVALNVTPERGDHFLADVSWGSEADESTSTVSQQLGDPTEWEPLAKVEFEPMEVVMAKDLDDKPYLNTVGDPFETGLVVVKRIPTRVFVQYEAVNIDAPAWAASTAYKFGQYVTKSGVRYRCIQSGTSGTTGPTTTVKYQIAFDGTVMWNTLGTPVGGPVNLDEIEDRCDTTNSLPFRGRAAGTLLLEVRNAEQGIYFGMPLWRIEYAMKYRPDGWKHKVLNMGYRYKDTSTSEAVLAGGRPFFVDKVTGTHYLGKLQADGTPVADQILGSPAQLEFRVFEETDFNTFLRVP